MDTWNHVNSIIKKKKKKENLENMKYIWKIPPLTRRTEIKKNTRPNNPMNLDSIKQKYTKIITILNIFII